MSPGHCEIEAALNGFESRLTTVDIDAGDTTRDLTLAVAPLSERVTVTTTKAGAADVQSTPVAITVLPARTLDQMGVRSVKDLAGVVPNVTIAQQNGLAQVTIRGIGTNSTVVGADPSSAVYVDGVYLGRPAMVFADFLNIERVEVLRGPQGTLYGRNAVGGTINIVSRQPTNTFESSARITAGSYDEVRAEAAVSGPLLRNKVMGGVAFLRGSREGFVEDLDHPDHSLGSDDTWAGRGQLRLVFGPRSELLLSGDYGRFDGIPLTNAKPIVPKPPSSFDNPASLWTVHASTPALGKNIQQGASAKLVVPLNGTTTVSSLTAYRKSDDRFVVDGDSTELVVGVTDVPDLQHQVSEELTVARGTPRLTLVGGAFFFRDHNEGQVEITNYPAMIADTPVRDDRHTGLGLFGQATYRASTRVSMSGGVRYSDEQKDLDTTGGVYRIGTPTLISPATFYAFVETANFDAWTPKASIQVQAARDTFAYFSATRGFKSGGFNPGEAVPEKAAFDPEFAWSYEGGLKRTMADGRIRSNTAVFYTTYEDLQVLSFVRPGVPEISNAGAATIKGVESRGCRSRGPRRTSREPGVMARRHLRSATSRVCPAARRCSTRQAIA